MTPEANMDTPEGKCLGVFRKLSVEWCTVHECPFLACRANAAEDEVIRLRSQIDDLKRLMNNDSTEMRRLCEARDLAKSALAEQVKRNGELFAAAELYRAGVHSVYGGPSPYLDKWQKDLDMILDAIPPQPGEIEERKP